MAASTNFERVLITGGAGFVGSNLVRYLQRQQPEAELLVIDDFRSGSFVNLCGGSGGAGKSGESRPEGAGVKGGGEAAGGGAWDDDFIFTGELIARPLGELDLYEIAEDFDPDVILHVASITDTTVTDQAKMIADNVEPFEVLLALAVERGVKLVWASSAATYGTAARGAAAARRPFALEDAGQPSNIYGFSKWLMENLHRQVQAEHPEAHLVGLRYFNVYGPGEASKAHMASMIQRLAQQMLQGQRPRIFHDGQQARDQVNVTDVVEATLAGAADSARSGIYNVGSGKATTFNAIVAALNKALGTALEPDYFPNPYPFYQDFTCADLTQSRKGLHWSPRYEPAEAIAGYARWLAERFRPQKT